MCDRQTKLSASCPLRRLHRVSLRCVERIWNFYYSMRCLWMDRWAAQLDLLPGATYAPTLYGFGDRVEDWAAEASKLPRGDQVIIVSCSVGGSCALEVAALAPERVAALVLIGTKAARRPDPALQATAVKTLREQGLEAAWREWWGPPFRPRLRPRSSPKRRASLCASRLRMWCLALRHSTPAKAEMMSFRHFQAQCT